MWKWLLAFALFATEGFAQENGSAYEALRVVGMRMNREVVNHVISVTGVDGIPQPKTWKILLEDRSARGGVREVDVANGRIVSQRTPIRSVVGTTAGATIATARLNLDSTGAYAVASHTAESSHTVFALVSYTLRTDERGNPTWIVTLEDQASRPVGTIHIGANKGSVTRVEGMYKGTNMAQVESDQTELAPADEDNDGDGDENIVKKRIKQMFHRTKEDATRMFQSVRRSFEDFFYRR